MEDLIRKLIKKHKTSCPFELATAVGIHIRFADLGDSTKGIYYKKLRRRFIVINIKLNDEWKRFVCAHELGHDRLHRGVGFYFIEENTFFNSGKFEREANEFATKLLLHGSEIEEGITCEQHLRKHNIPSEMAKYLTRYC